MQKITPKTLRSTVNGREFAYTPILASRPDMVPVWPEGVDPNYGEGAAPADKISDTRAALLLEELRSKDALAESLNRQIDELRDQNSEMREEIARLSKALSTSEEIVRISKAFSSQGVSETTVRIGEVPDVGMKDYDTDESDPIRMGKIIDAAKGIIASGDSNLMTNLGKIRIEPLEARAGVQGITSSERDHAMKAAKQ